MALGTRPIARAKSETKSMRQDEPSSPNAREITAVSAKRRRFSYNIKSPRDNCSGRRCRRGKARLVLSMRRMCRRPLLRMLRILDRLLWIQRTTSTPLNGYLNAASAVLVGATVRLLNIWSSGGVTGTSTIVESMKWIYTRTSSKPTKQQIDLLEPTLLPILRQGCQGRPLCSNHFHSIKPRVQGQQSFHR